MEQSGENARPGAPGDEERDEARADGAPMTGAATPGGTPDMEDQVRRRAYELYVARGGQPGREFDDWYAAEQEVRGRQGAAPSAGRGASAPQREPDADARSRMAEAPAEPGEPAAAPRKRSAPSRRGRPRGEG